jgi:hypothetical protein
LAGSSALSSSLAIFIASVPRAYLVTTC